MKKVILLLALMFVVNRVEGAEIFRHNFFTEYDPTSVSFVFNDSGITTTGDSVAVNTYLQKTIQITSVVINEDIEVQIQGRVKDQINPHSGLNSGVANWAVLDTVNFGAASDDDAVNKIVDVTEYVDFLRIGIKVDGTTGTSSIDIEGIFTNLER